MVERQVCSCNELKKFIKTPLLLNLQKFIGTGVSHVVRTVECACVRVLQQCKGTHTVHDTTISMVVKQT